MSKPIRKQSEETNEDSGQTLSVWMDTATLPLEAPLTQKEFADVCIVGAGIAGMTTAYLISARRQVGDCS